MKKLFLLLAAALCTAGQAVAAEELTLGSLAGWGWSKKTVSTVEVPQLPAAVTLPGQYGEISITESFDATQIAKFKATFGEPLAAGKVQISVRNQAQTSSYQNQYIHLEGGITEYEGTIDLSMLGDDTQVVAFAFMNDGNQDDVTLTLNNFVFTRTDGTEWRPQWKGSGWPTGSLTPLTEAPGGEQKEVYEFTSRYAEVGVDFGGTVAIGEDQHFIRLVSSEPLPEGFQWKVYWADGSNGYPSWVLGGNSTSVELTQDYTGISIQHTASTTSTLPGDIKLFREIRYSNGAISREQLPIKVGSNGTAVIIDPNPAAEVGENGLPAKVVLSSQWQDIKLWKTDFDVTEYPAYKIVLREPLADPADIQMFYRTESHGSQGAVYVPWETDEDMMVEISEDGRVMSGEFDIDALEGDNVVLRFALQNRTGNNVGMIIEGVYLINEDEEEIPTEGLVADGWNAGTILPVGGSYDDDGNIWDAIVEFNAANDYLGTYSGTVEEGTYHKVTFYTEEPMPEGVAAMVMNIGLNWDTWEWTFDPVENEQEGYGTTALTVTIPSSYNSLYVGYYGDESLLPLRVRFTKIVREVFEKEIPTAIEGTQGDATAKVVRVEFFNAAGAKLAQPTKGMTIVRETLSDGTMRSKKVMKK